MRFMRQSRTFTPSVIYPVRRVAQRSRALEPLGLRTAAHLSAVSELHPSPLAAAAGSRLLDDDLLSTSGCHAAGWVRPTPGRTWQMGRRRDCVIHSGVGPNCGTRTAHRGWRGV